jgi:diketogulonate reductase-like aldo/keto reductase
MAVWRVFEEFVSNRKVRFIGLSNTYDINMLQEIYEKAEIKPTFLQNRFYSETGHDQEVRAFCESKGMRYQSFWTLTANPKPLRGAVVSSLAKKYQKTNEQVFYRFVQHLGIIPLSGTTSPEHMAQDLDLASFELTSAEIESIKVSCFGKK